MSLFAPNLEWQNLEWHQACVSSGVLCIMRCTSCGIWRHPPRRYCGSCWSGESRYEPVSGDGAVASYAISHRVLDPAWAEKVPFATLVVELDEGPRVLARFDGPPHSVRIGDEMTVSVEPDGDDFVMLRASRRR